MNDKEKLKESLLRSLLRHLYISGVNAALRELDIKQSNEYFNFLCEFSKEIIELIVKNES